MIKLSCSSDCWDSFAYVNLRYSFSVRISQLLEIVINNGNNNNNNNNNNNKLLLLLLLLSLFMNLCSRNHETIVHLRTKNTKNPH